MIKDIKELEKLFKLCRKQGVESIELDGCKIKFGDLPSKPVTTQLIESEEIAELSDEHILDWALGANQ